MSTNESQVKGKIQATAKKSTHQQDKWLESVLNVRLDMAHGWREMLDWGADAKSLIEAFEHLRDALRDLPPLDPSLIVHRDRIKKSLDELTAAQITNDRTVREAKQREIEALTAKTGALESAQALLGRLVEPACQVPAEAQKNEAQAIDLAVAALRKKLADELTPEIVLQANSDLEKLAKLVTATGKTIQDRKAWSARYATVGKTFNAESGNFDPALAPTLNTWWKAVSGEAAAKDYVAALNGVKAIEQVLARLPATQEAAKFARHQQALAAKALDKADADALKKDLDAAEALLAKLDKPDDGAKKLEDAQKAFETVTKAYTAALKKGAKGLEKTDGGHSLDRHGPDVSDDLLKRRVEKGLAADNVLSPTHSSTKFDKVEDWIETRDAAILKILKDNGVDPKDPPPASGTSYTGVIEHNKPIDSGFVADKTTAKDEVMTDDTGQPVYELKKGKKRWTRNDKGEPLDADGQVVPYAGAEKNPKDKNGAPVLPDNGHTAQWPPGIKPPELKVKTFKVYTAHTKVSGLTRTLTTIESDGTKWKVVQHFPHAEGWDPVKKKYTTPI